MKPVELAGISRRPLGFRIGKETEVKSVDIAPPSGYEKLPPLSIPAVRLGSNVMLTDCRVVAIVVTPVTSTGLVHETALVSAKPGPLTVVLALAGLEPVG